MKKIENHCVDCGLPCLGNGCPYVNVPVYYCDECNNEADYRIDNEDYCSYHAEKYVNKVLDDLPLEEQSKLLHDILSEYTLEEKADLLELDITDEIDYEDDGGQDDYDDYYNDMRRF